MPATNAIYINKVLPSGLEQLQGISRKTFLETFASVNSEENMKQYLEENLSLHKLRQEISNPGSEFYFAEYNNEVIGYLKVNTGQAQTELKHRNTLEIERIYVIKEFHGRYAGQQLYEYALQIAHAKQVAFVWLGVWENNHRAIRFYQKNGFVPFDKHIFRLGNDEQTDILMRLQLNLSQQ